MGWGFGLHKKGKVSSLPAFIPIRFLTRDTVWAATSSSCHLASPAMMACILQLWLKRSPSLSCFCCLFCQGSKKTTDYDRSLVCCLAGSTCRHVTPSGSLRSLGNRTETLRLTREVNLPVLQFLFSGGLKASCHTIIKINLWGLEQRPGVWDSKLLLEKTRV